MLQDQNTQDFQERGFTKVRGLFSKEEVAFYKQHYMKLRHEGSYEGDFSGVDLTDYDPLKDYPRMIHMHRWDENSLNWMTDARLNECMTAFLGESPFAAQTMLYFKPPGSRGQALHQDNYFLQVKPGTCMAAWLALDNCDEENGCLRVVPNTHETPELCTENADTSQSFTDMTVPLAEGMSSEPVVMKAGDVLFFNGQLIHGSFPNTSETRFRRALIGHYIVAKAEKVAEFYHPVLRMDGSEIQLGISERGGECGVWVEPEKRVEMKQVQP